MQTVEISYASVRHATVPQSRRVVVMLASPYAELADKEQHPVAAAVEDDGEARPLSTVWERMRDLGSAGEEVSHETGRPTSSAQTLDRDATDIVLRRDTDKMPKSPGPRCGGAWRRRQGEG